jgi:hypothetical protein
MSRLWQNEPERPRNLGTFETQTAFHLRTAVPVPYMVMSKVGTLARR